MKCLKFASFLSSKCTSKCRMRNYSHFVSASMCFLTHRGRVPHESIRNLSVAGSDNGLSHVHCQNIPKSIVAYCKLSLESNFKEIVITVHAFTFKNIHLKVSAALVCHFDIGLQVSKIGIKWNIESNQSYPNLQPHCFAARNLSNPSNDSSLTIFPYFQVSQELPKNVLIYLNTFLIDW